MSIPTGMVMYTRNQTKDGSNVKIIHGNQSITNLRPSQQQDLLRGLPINPQQVLQRDLRTNPRRALQRDHRINPRQALQRDLRTNPQQDPLPHPHTTEILSTVKVQEGKGERQEPIVITGLLEQIHQDRRQELADLPVGAMLEQDEDKNNT